MASLPKPLIMPDEYLEMDRAAEFRSEYISGEMLMMAGNTHEHVEIVSNLVRELGVALKGRPCHTYSNELRTKAKDTAYLYPDVIVTCGEPEFADDRFDTLTNPTVIIEVLSPSTTSFDRGKKFAIYRLLASLHHYVVVAQDAASADVYTRMPNGHWDVVYIEGLDQALDFPAIDCRISMSEIYYRISFPSDPQTSV